MEEHMSNTNGMDRRTVFEKHSSRCRRIRGRYIGWRRPAAYPRRNRHRPDRKIPRL